METAAYPMYIDLFVTQHKKTDLMYTNTHIFILQYVSHLATLEIYKLRTYYIGFPMNSCIHGVSFIRLL